MIKYDFRKFNERPIMGFIDMLDTDKPEFNDAEKDLNKVVFFMGNEEVLRINDNGFLHDLVYDLYVAKSTQKLKGLKNNES